MLGTVFFGHVLQDDDNDNDDYDDTLYHYIPKEDEKDTDVLSTQSSCYTEMLG